MNPILVVYPSTALACLPSEGRSWSNEVSGLNVSHALWGLAIVIASSSWIFFTSSSVIAEMLSCGT